MEKLLLLCGGRDSRAAPASFPPEEYSNVDVELSEEKGWFCFVEYTIKGRSAMVRRRDGWKYCYNHSDKEELYNIADDPIEMHNLSMVSEHREIKDQLKSQLME